MLGRSYLQVQILKTNSSSKVTRATRKILAHICTTVTQNYDLQVTETVKIFA